jgi:hypothetical protein
MNYCTFRQMSILWAMLIVSDPKSRRLNSQARGYAMVKISSLRKSIYLLQNIRKLRKTIGLLSSGSQVPRISRFNYVNTRKMRTIKWKRTGVLFERIWSLGKKCNISFLRRFFLNSITDNTFTGLWITPKSWCFCGIHVANICSFLCYVLCFFVFFVLYLVFNVGCVYEFPFFIVPLVLSDVFSY